MNSLTERATAIGHFLITCGKLDSTTYKKKVKLQKIVGCLLFYEAATGEWFYATKKIRALSVDKLNELSSQIESQI